MPSHLTPAVRKRLAQVLRGTLRTARQSAALTQEQMARRVGLGTSTYGRLERGAMAPGLETLRQLSQALCLSLEDLVGGECAAAVTRPRPSVPRPRAPRALARPVAPRRDVLTLLLVRHGMPLALVVDMVGSGGGGGGDGGRG